MIDKDSLDNNAVDPATLRKRRERESSAASPVTDRQQPVDELATLKARIEAARTVQPPTGEAHCLDCFDRGRNAALRVIDGE